jgi:oxygen-dependent protoporphyrinogen oxidase
VGRFGETADLGRDDAELTRLVRADLERATGLGGEPLGSAVTRWGGALPQYAVGHLDRVARVRAAVAAVPGLAVCGATYDGIGIAACIASARQAATAVLRSTPDGAQWASAEGKR